MIPDRIGRKSAIIAMSFLQGLIMLAMYHGFINLGLALGLIVGATLIGALIMLLTRAPGPRPEPQWPRLEGAKAAG